MFLWSPSVIPPSVTLTRALTLTPAPTHGRIMPCVHSMTFTSEWLLLSCSRAGPLPKPCPYGDIVLASRAPLVLQTLPEMTVDKQREQTVTPTSIDLAPLPLLFPPNNTTLIPPTLNLYESPHAPTSPSTSTDKNDECGGAHCPTASRLLSGPLQTYFSPIECTSLFSDLRYSIASGPSYNFLI